MSIWKEIPSLNQLSFLVTSHRTAQLQCKNLFSPPTKSWKAPASNNTHMSKLNARSLSVTVRRKNAGVKTFPCCHKARASLFRGWLFSRRSIWDWVTPSFIPNGAWGLLTLTSWTWLQFKYFHSYGHFTNSSWPKIIHWTRNKLNYYRSELCCLKLYRVPFWVIKYILHGVGFKGPWTWENISSRFYYKRQPWKFPTLKLSSEL